MMHLQRDLAHALRSLRRQRGYVATVLVTLATGIGVTTAIFAGVYAALFRPLPVADPRGLVRIATVGTQRSALGTLRSDRTSYEDFWSVRQGARQVRDLAAYAFFPASIWTRGGSRAAQGVLVSGDYFRLLGLRATRGRLLEPSDEGAPGATPFVVVSDRFWREWLGGSATAVGSTIVIGESPFTVVGVAPAGFAGLEFGVTADLWVPITMQAQAEGLKRNEYIGPYRDARRFRVVGRLAPGATQERLAVEVQRIGADLATSFPQTNAGRGFAVAPFERLDGAREAARSLELLFGLVLVVLLIVCANIATLALARASRRTGDMALRLAMGAERYALIRLVLAESLLLGVGGGALGCVVAASLTYLIGARTPAVGHLAVDPAVIGFGLGLGLLAGALFGLGPAFTASRQSIRHVLSTSQMLTTRRRTAGRNALVVAQVAMSLAFVTLALALGRELRRLTKVDVGYAVNEVLIGRELNAPAARNVDQRHAFYRELLRVVGEVPGVRNVSLGEGMYFQSPSMRYTVAVPGVTPADGKLDEVDFDVVGPSYFRTVGIPLQRGREFTVEDDRAAPLRIIVNTAMARRFWPGADPVGRVVLVRGATPMEVIGVVADSRQSLRDVPQPRFYRPFLQTLNGTAKLQVRFRGAPEPVAAAVTRAILAWSPALHSQVHLRPLAEYRDLTLRSERTMAMLVSVFGLLALVLASIGLYGLITFLVATRERELGVRLALGAQRSRIALLIATDAAHLLVAGAGVGAVLVLGVRLLGLQALEHVSLYDPPTLLVALLLLLLVGFVALVGPIRRALRIPPALAMRAD